MAWLLLTVTGVLALLVVALAVLTVRLGRRIESLERRLASSDAHAPSRAVFEDSHTSVDEARPAAEYVITRVGEPVEPEVQEPAPTVEAGLFADLVLRESVVQAASFAHGLRRALAPETRNRIRFHMRQEVKRSRKQRRAELRAVRREWAARQRAAMAADDRVTESSVA